MAQAVDIQFVSHIHQPKPQPKADKRTMGKSRVIWGNSWFLSVFHKGAVIYSRVDHNPIVINSHTVQLVPQQVSAVDRGHTQVSHSVLMGCAMQNEE